MQLGCLQHTNEHENKSTPCAQNLDGPPTCLGGEDWKFLTSAIRVIPEIIPVHAAVALFATSPRRESSSFTIHLKGGALGTAQFPRANNENQQGLNVYHKSCQESPSNRLVFLPTSISFAGDFTSPIDKLGEIEHHSQHQCNLEAVEKIHGASSSTSIHDRGANIQNGRKDHRPTSCTNHGWQRQTKNTNGSQKLTQRHGFHCRTVIIIVHLWGWTSVGAFLLLLLLDLWEFAIHEVFCCGTVQCSGHGCFEN